jgi:hypothetical protein
MKKVTPTLDELPPNLTRARSREAAFAGVQRDLFSEMGSALARANEKVELAMAELDRRAEKLARARERREPNAVGLAVAFNEQRERARTALWELRVHREALGLYDHRNLDKAWPIPPRAPQES